MTTTIWLVRQSRYDDELLTVHGAFTDEADARAYAEAMPHVEVAPVALYGPGEQPPIVEAWVAAAEVPVPNRAHARSSRPTVRLERFAAALGVPDWARQPCELAECSVNDGRTLEIVYRGADRDAVLAACRSRYNRAVEAMS